MRNEPTSDMKPLNKRPISYRRVGDLSIHPTIDGDPRLAPKDPRYLAMKSAWRESASLPPLFVTPSGSIVDGRHRYWHAQDEEMEEVPCVEVSEAEVPLIVLQGLTGKNHVTKGQRAYLAVPKLAAAFEAAQARRVELLNSGLKARIQAIPTPDDLAEMLGLGRNILFQARRIHEHFTSNKKLRKEWEPKILDAEEPMGLGSVLQGIGGAEATKGKPKPLRNSALRNFTVGWSNLTKPAAHWAKWSQEDREWASESVRTAISKLPPEILDVVASAIRAARKQAQAQTEA